MRFFNNKARKNKKKLEERGIFTGPDYPNNPLYGTFNYQQSTAYSASKALNVSTFNRCLNLIGDSIASTPILPYKINKGWKFIDDTSSLNNLLNIEPNKYMGAFTFKKLTVTNMILTGDSYIYVKKNRLNQAESFTLKNSGSMKVVFVDGELKYEEYKNPVLYDRSEIIHIMNYTENGIEGQSTLSHASVSLGISYNSDQHSNNFFKSGGALAGILRPILGGNITKEKALAAKTSWKNASGYNSTTLDTETNQIIVLDSGLEYQPISISPADSQLLESRKFNVYDICRFMNVPPSLAFSDGSSYATNEMEQISYLNNCLQPIMEKIENEFFRKLYLESEWEMNSLAFDVENLLRLDATTKIDVLTKQFGIGVTTTNEARAKYNKPTKIEGGDRAFVPVNLQPTDALISEQKKVSDPLGQIDNKLKTDSTEDVPKNNNDKDE